MDYFAHQDRARKRSIWLIVYFVVSIPLLVTWLLSIQRHPLMPEWARWTWGVGIALVPMVGVVFHVRVFRRAPPPTPSSP